MGSPGVTTPALEAVRAADAVCFGTLAQRGGLRGMPSRSSSPPPPPTALRVFDINVRQHYFSRDVIEQSLRLANVLKLNDDELPILAQLFGLTGSIRHQIETLAQTFSLQLVALTRGPAGSLLFQAGEWSDCPSVPTIVVDTIGAGDAFTAALVLGDCVACRSTSSMRSPTKLRATCAPPLGPRRDCQSTCPIDTPRRLAHSRLCLVRWRAKTRNMTTTEITTSLVRHRLRRALSKVRRLIRGAEWASTGAGRRRDLPRRARTFFLLAAGLATALLSMAARPQGSYMEPFRPQYHFTPEKNWMNDPNGMVFYEGEYHLFYQYNPAGDKWGHMSWGHAVSPDMVHWTHLPLALPEADNVMIFSGSAVVDWKNSSGFGTDGRPPLVAVYTGYRTTDRVQFQCIAFSNDKGRTWTKYRDNPVIDINSTDFRDPKVQWHDATRRWIMTVSLSAEHKVRFYGSDNLKVWTLLSEFGPAGATGGVWECPDLFELPLPATNDKRWVLVVNMNPGSVAGGSGGQYFIGRFDGTRFVADRDSLITAHGWALSCRISALV